MSQRLATPGTIIGGRFRVEEKLGPERDFVRFTATHLDLDHLVELHVLPDAAQKSSDWHSRFRQQVRVLSKLRHPNLVRTFDYGQLENGAPYYVVGLVEGPTLFRELAEGALRPERTVEIVREVLSGLDYAHRLGILHLNLTPSRIFLPDRPAGLTAQVADLMPGRWHLIDDAEPVSDARVIAPEVLRGAAPTPAADIYGIGHLTYNCLFGGLPLQMVSEEQAREAHLSARPWQVPQYPGVPDSLVAFVQRCLSKSPEDRFPDARSAIQCLDQWNESRSASTTGPPSVPPAGVFPRIGETFGGRYRIDAHVGSGGFARVFDAHDTQDDRRVALKLLHPNWLGNDREVRRFNQEGKIAFTLLESRHIPRVYDYGEGDDGLWFIAFEFVEGDTLSAVIDRAAPMNPRRVGLILLQAFSALTSAHDVGIFHRDIKPSNLLLSSVDGKDRLHLLDFGVAKVDNIAITGADLTATGTTMGTIRYLPPEAHFGRPYGADSDLYSLGLVAYEMLTGEKAISGSSAGEIIANQIAPQAVELSLDGTDVDDLRFVVNRMLRKDREARYSAAQEAFRELQRFVKPTDVV